MEDEATAQVEEGVTPKEESPTPETPETQSQEVTQITETPETPETEEQKTQRKHATASDRIRFLDRENKTKQTLIDERDKRIQELEVIEAKRAVSEIKRPDEDSFETHDQYLDAMDKYSDDRSEARESIRREQVQRQEQIDKNQEYTKPFMDKVEQMDDVGKSIYDEAAANLLTDGSESLLDAQKQAYLIENPNVGPELLIHLHQNPQLLKEVNSMNIWQWPQKLNEISSNLVKAKNGKTVTGAPKPASILDGTGSGIDKKLSELEDEPYSVWKAKREAQEKSRVGYY